MRNGCVEEEVIVHPVGGMQLSSGYIRTDADRHVVGHLPGIASQWGNSVEEVLNRLDWNAKIYYGSDVVVELSGQGARG